LIWFTYLPCAPFSRIKRCFSAFIAMNRCPKFGTACKSKFSNALDPLNPVLIGVLALFNSPKTSSAGFQSRNLHSRMVYWLLLRHLGQ
jgi:hypothetical protein